MTSLIIRTVSLIAIHAIKAYEWEIFIIIFSEYKTLR